MRESGHSSASDVSAHVLRVTLEVRFDVLRLCVKERGTAPHGSTAPCSLYTLIESRVMCVWVKKESEEKRIGVMKDENISDKTKQKHEHET